MQHSGRAFECTAFRSLHVFDPQNPILSTPSERIYMIPGVTFTPDLEETTTPRGVDAAEREHRNTSAHAAAEKSPLLELRSDLGEDPSEPTCASVLTVIVNLTHFIL